MNVSFTSESFRGFEEDGSMQISVVKLSRTATPFSVAVSLFNVSDANRREIIPPENALPENDEFRSNYAESKSSKLNDILCVYVPESLCN